MGAYLVAKYALPLMRPKSRPRILILSGGGAFDPMPHVSAYGVSKAATVRLVETLAVELKPRNIAVNAIAPGFAPTEIHEATVAAGRERAGEHFDKTEKLMLNWDNSMDVPIECVRYMVSERSAKLTGKTISARYDPWGEPEFDEHIDQIVASPLYSTQRTMTENVPISSLAKSLGRYPYKQKTQADRANRIGEHCARCAKPCCFNEINSVSAATCFSLYKMARLIRRTQEILIEEYTAKQEMRCPMHFCIGQEGTPTALSPLLRAEDYIVSHYRSHGYYLAKGAPLTEMLAEFHGKVTGSNSGFAGSMELAHEEKRIFSGAIVGGPIAIAMGIAFAVKYREVPGIVIAVVGDGSLDEGASYEALNLAALHAVPLLIICENNLYAAHTPEPLRTKSRSLVDRVRPFGMRTDRLDGMDIPRLHLNLCTVIEEMRAGNGPRFIEVETYRYCGHVGPENDDWLEYRTADEIAAWRRRDPVPALRAETLRLGTSETALRLCETDIEREIDSALAAARSASFPDYQWSLDQVWSQSYSPIVKEFVRDREAAFDSNQAETRLKPY